MMYNITGLKISLDHLNRTGIGYKLKFFQLFRSAVIITMSTVPKTKFFILFDCYEILVI